MNTEQQLQHWVAAKTATDISALRWQALAGDASFRRYFRCQANGERLIVALAPPATENNAAFAAVAAQLNQAGVLAPIVHAIDYQAGYVLQSDLGQQLLSDLLTATTVDAWYQQAMQQLQQMLTINTQQLPAYDQPALALELAYFHDWFLQGLLDYCCSDDEEKMLTAVFDKLIASALQQPQVFVHRDYHCRNIIVTAEQALATIDFQDAVCGAVTYDLASLLRDCYVVWPDQQIRAWVKQYWQALLAANVVDVSLETFQQWFDYMGLQRHIKVLGIFSRLSLRDDKHAYLQDLPTVINYVLAVACQQSDADIQHFAAWFRDKLLPIIRQQTWGSAL